MVTNNQQHSMTVDVASRDSAMYTYIAINLSHIIDLSRHANTLRIKLCLPGMQYCGYKRQPWSSESSLVPGNDPAANKGGFLCHNVKYDDTAKMGRLDTCTYDMHLMPINLMLYAELVRSDGFTNDCWVVTIGLTTIVHLV